MMNRRLLYSVLLSLLALGLLAQESESPLKLKSQIGLRYMSTHNRGDLADFNTQVFFGQFKADYAAKPWLTFSGQLNGIYLPWTSGLEERDVLTGRGPIYEANLFNRRTMTGQIELALPIFNAQFNHSGHILTIGRFTKDVQAFRQERWPFPNALEGIWYENYTAEKTSWQLALIHRVMPRFSGDFEKVGDAIGVAGIGVNPDGTPSGYRNEVNSNVIIAANYNRQLSNYMTIDIWNYWIDNVMNTMLLEPKVHWPDQSLTLSAKIMYQFKVGEGGNALENLRYVQDDRAIYFGVRAEKQLGKSSLQLNLTRITNDGRFLMPRELGFEPFYTFQRRTRIEGVANAWALMLKWKQAWADQQFKYQFNSSIGKNELPDITDFANNKYRVPSHLHWDAELKVQPLKKLTGLTAEVLVAYRFLAANVDNEMQVLINQADFFHTDMRLTYTF